MTDEVAPRDVGSQPSNELTTTSSSKRRHKMNKACVACRSTKTKCLPSKFGDSCEACVKKSRLCVPTGPIKPRIKSSEKFSELEKKIESLTKALGAKHQPPTPPESGRSIVSSEDLIQDRNTYTTAQSLNQLPDRLEKTTLSRLPDDLRTTRRTCIDVIDQGFIDYPTAEVLFNHYSISMQPILPIVNFSGENHLDRVRATKPMSLLAILAVSSASILPSFEHRLIMELNEQLARHIFIVGARSLDLVQAMLIYSQYYIRPAASKNFTQTHFVSSAVAMSYDLSIHRTEGSSRGPRNQTEHEHARTWLSCWFAASLNSIVLHQPSIVSATNEVDSGLQRFLSDFESSHNDQWLFRLFRLQRLVEDTKTIYGPMSSKPVDSLDDNANAMKLKMCQQRLEDWKSTGTPNLDTRLNACAIHFAELVVHQIAMRNVVNRVYASYHANKATPGATGFSLCFAPWQLEAIWRCVVSCQGLLDIYCGLEDSLVRSLPNMFLVWTIFAGFTLVKLGYLAEGASSPDSSIMANMLSQKSTPEFLDAMVTKIDVVSRNGYLPQAKGFGLAFKKLKSYYLQKKHTCLHSGGDCEFGVDGEAAEVVDPLGGALRQSAMDPSNEVLGESDWQSVEFRQSPGGSSSARQTVLEQPLQVFTEVSQDMTDAPDASFPDVYNPSAYDRTDWNDFVLDDVAMREINDFMMEDDPGWMRSFL
ncbi:hypothetical protein LTR84_006413 [Exophiala bonariae]|uniref:Zn(2)-C6 fungal-type domain-containing protein n=1 Tax=Exophiala bonariae TaxID=1690606 RepID=A0AAV9N1U3_9EURO|nr:hypothetical protein LTR84_006413 [Exophiala bonariae]